jgi:UDP-N-acetylglucosamine:LPS N-acetylglucosamine transferase
VKELMGDVEIVYTPARPGDFGGKVVCSQRALRELGWSASTPFRDGVAKYVEWRLENEKHKAEASEAAVIPAGEPDHEAEPRKILIISADIGEGHDLPARAVMREFHDEDPDAQISIVNGLPAMGPILTKVLRENSAFMFRWVPWWFDLQYRLFMNFAPTRWLALRLLTAFGRRGLMRLIRAEDPDLIVSTYPGVTAVLGELRRKGRLETPCYSSITDLAGLQFWAHPGIDLHFITHPESAEEVEKIAGPGSVRWAKPPTNPAFLAARSRDEARKALGLPSDKTVIAVSGGGWGVGDLVGATEAALNVPDALVLCLCGRNDTTRARVAERFGDEPRLRLMGFTDRMGDVLAASDALVHSSAGLTVLEAIIRGCPVISYGFGYGHVRASNAALERFGLAQVAKRKEDLGPALERALAKRPEPDNSFARRPSTASLILTDERRARTLPRWRVRTTRTATGFALAMILAALVLTTGASYQLVSHFVHMKPVTAFATDRPEVGVIVDASSLKTLPALERSVSSNGLHVSFAVDGHWSPSISGSLPTGDQAVPLLPGGGLVRWLATRSLLHSWTAPMGSSRHHFYYASSGPSLGQYLMARGTGGKLVGGAVRLHDRDDSVGALKPGEVVEVTATNDADVAMLLGKLRAQLSENHLDAVPVGQLVRDSASTA